MTHFIRQQYFDVELKGSESDGFALQHRLSDLYYAQLLPAIEKALDQCSTSGQHFVIDRLDIDAGTIELECIDQDLAPVIANALARDIREKSVIRQADKEEQTGSYMMDSEENLWEVFIHFIAKGSLPWSYRLPTGKSLEEVISELLMNDGIINSNRILADRIEIKLKSPNAAKRLELQFSENFITLLRQKIYPIQVDSFDQSRQGNLWEVFIHFLLNGNFPGMYKLPPEVSLEDALTDLLNDDDTNTIHPIPVPKIAEVFKSPFAANRLAFQFSEPFLLKLLERISPDTLVELKSILSVSENLSFAPDQARLVRKFVLEKTISLIFSGKSISKVEIARQVMDELQISSDLHLLVSKVFEQTWPEIKMPDNELSDTIERLIPLGKNLETTILQRDLSSSYPNLSGIKIIENKAPSSEALAIEK
ncbi:MAG TPA: contractile injection system tape measure protein, partial [Prolixibacteraceae bacterium]|nr:contractile injection system tape measure protein [Prolixibacteraceae bacterium]